MKSVELIFDTQDIASVSISVLTNANSRFPFDWRQTCALGLRALSFFDKVRKVFRLADFFAKPRSIERCSVGLSIQRVSFVQVQHALTG